MIGSCRPSNSILKVSPAQRLRWAKLVFDWSVWLLVPIVVVTWIWQRVGIALLQVLSVLAVTVTMWDVMLTADIREVEDDK